jgi:hypothetical protein
VATVVALADLVRSPTAQLFEGRDEAPVSIFVTRYEHGQGPDLHLHPYAEVFVVEEGTATFTAGDEELVVDAGHVVVVPPRRRTGSRTAPPRGPCGCSACTRARRSSRPTSSARCRRGCPARAGLEHSPRPPARRPTVSKCKPKEGLQLNALSAAGVRLEDYTETVDGAEQRTVAIKIPYDALREDPDVQRAFADLVTIATD